MPVCQICMSLYDYIKKAELIAASNDIKMVCFGHALDGNLHTMLMFDDGRSADDKNTKRAILEIYKYVVSIGGVISGEHGIGMIQREFMKIQHSEQHMELLRRIKRLIDPNNIMNPGKLV